MTALALLCGSATLLPLSAHAAPVVESLSRGVVAVHQPDGKVYVSWRLLASDPDGVAFNVYRETAPARGPAAMGGNPATRTLEEPVVRLNPEPLTGPGRHRHVRRGAVGPAVADPQRLRDRLHDLHRPHHDRPERVAALRPEASSACGLAQLSHTTRSRRCATTMCSDSATI